jgi:hypothetical protein
LFREPIKELEVEVKRRRQGKEQREWLWKGKHFLLNHKEVIYMLKIVNFEYYVTRQIAYSHTGPPAACRQNFGFSKVATLVEPLENL